MTEGEKDIEDIQVGDWVIADDPTTPGEIEARQVLETFVRETDGLVDLYVDGEVISTTAEHPFWVPDKGWVEAKDLKVGSLLQTDDGRIVDVDRIEKREGKFEVYNFKVEDFHTYFVSDLGILVHNADCGDNILQSGGRTLKNSTSKALNEFSGQNLESGEWGKRLEKLKKSLGQGGRVHSHAITRSGDVYMTEDFGDFQAGDWIGNLNDV